MRSCLFSYTLPQRFHSLCKSGASELKNKLFRTELNQLHELAAEFARVNPALAPLMDGSRTDPDAERILDAAAYNISMCRQILSGNFSELTHTLGHLILPHLLLPFPMTTIIGFTSRATAGQSFVVPAGTLIASPPVDGTRCQFATTADVEVHPLELTDATYLPASGHAGEIRLSLSLKGLPLSSWQPVKPLRMFLSGDYASATDLLMLFGRNVVRIILTAADGGSVTVPTNCLTLAGFTAGEELLPCQSQAFPGYQWVQEFFSTPEKFLFIDLNIGEQCRQLGDGQRFTISFELGNLPAGAPRVECTSFTINAVMAINLFAHDAIPVSINHRAAHYPVTPEGGHPDHYQVYTIDRVTGYTRATGQERDYLPFEHFGSSGSSDPAYHVQTVSLPGGPAVRISVAYPDEMPLPNRETLSITTTCTNRNLPGNLRVGDISEPLTALPGFVSARNITPINSGHSPSDGPELHRQLISHLCMNQLSLEHIEHLWTLLTLYVRLHGNGAAAAANLKRIAGITACNVSECEVLVEGVPMRGREIALKVRQDHFAGAGDMYLFGCTLDRFLNCQVSTNTCTRLTFNETTRGSAISWPIRLGGSGQSDLVRKPVKRDKPGRRTVVSTRPTEESGASLLDDLVAKGHEFSFRQVMRIARHTFGPGGREHIRDVPWQKRISIKPALSMAFPAADVARVERTGRDGSALLVTVTFLSMLHVLPTHYIEDQMDEAAADSSVSRDFMDIFHQRMYQIFLECQSKNQLFNRLTEENSGQDLERLHCLNGLGERELRSSLPEAWSAVRHAPLMNISRRSALGLQTLLRDTLGIGTVTVEPFVQRRAPIPDDQRMRLGISGIRLGVDSVLGSEVPDRMGKLRVHTGPLSYKDYDSLLPGTPRHKKLADLIRLYITDPLEFDLKMTLAAGEARPIRLGDPRSARLGFTTWLVSDKTPASEVSALFPITHSAEQTPSPADVVIPESAKPLSLIDHYQRELAHLLDLAARYAEANPNVASLISSDPGVGKLIQEMALLFAKLGLKIGDDIPEVITPLIEALQPWRVRPIPAMTIVAFTPKAGLVHMMPV